MENAVRSRKKTSREHHPGRSLGSFSGGFEVTNGKIQPTQQTYDVSGRRDGLRL